MITLAIPFFEGREFLHKALRSALGQTDREWRLIVCDDSLDNRVESLVTGLADGRIRYFRSPGRIGNLGTHNRCLELAETPFVTILHPRDELQPEYVGRFKKAWESHPEAAFLFCRTRKIDRKSRTKESWFRFFKNLRKRSPFQSTVFEGSTGATALRKARPTLRSACYQKNQFSNSPFSAEKGVLTELDFACLLLNQGKKGVELPESLYDERV